MQFTAEQQAAIENSGPLIVSAGAGSGKTRVLVERYLRLFDVLAADETVLNPAEMILAITFTEKAAREMRSRVRNTVEERARAAAPADRADWEQRRSNIEAARIGTIHSFCAALLRAQPAESGVDPRFTVLDEVAAGLLLAESVDEALAAWLARPHAEPPLLTSEFTLDELRLILNELLRGGGEIRAACAAMPASAAECLARINERVAAARAAALAELRAAPVWQSAVDTITELAAVADGNDRIGSQLLAVAAWLPGLADPAPDFSLLDGIHLTGGSKKNWPAPDDLAAAKNALRGLRDAYRDMQNLLELQIDTEFEQRAVQAVLELRELYLYTDAIYAERKRRQDALDFDDLERLTGDLLSRDAAVRERWRQELRALLVDEFQDTNTEQRTIIYALSGLLENDTTPELFVVGDGKQSIYRFRGADVSVFRQVAADIDTGGGRRVTMDTSFRCHDRLQRWINRVTEQIFARPAALQPYEFPFEPLRAHREDPPHSDCVELLIVEKGENSDAQRRAEAELLAARLQALVDGEAELVYDQKLQTWRRPVYGDIALLFQASTVFDYFEAALRAAKIPFLTTAGRGYYGRKEVQDMIHLLRVLNDPGDELALVGVLRSPLFALDDATILRLRLADRHSIWRALMQPGENESAELIFARETLADLYQRRGRLTVVELLRASMAATGYLATVSGLPDGERRRVNLEKLIEAARMAGRSGLSDFSEYLENLLRSEPREGEAPLEAEGSVRLMTVHRSKGLEFPIVCLPDLGRNPPPLRRNWLAGRAQGLALQLRDRRGQWQPPAAFTLQLAEERRKERAERERLLYVALTRAQDYLILSGPEAAKSGEDWLSRILLALDQPWEAGGFAPGRHVL